MGVYIFANCFFWILKLIEIAFDKENKRDTNFNWLLLISFVYLLIGFPLFVLEITIMIIQTLIMIIFSPYLMYKYIKDI